MATESLFSLVAGDLGEAKMLSHMELPIWLTNLLNEELDFCHDQNKSLSLFWSKAQLFPFFVLLGTPLLFVMH